MDALVEQLMDSADAAGAPLAGEGGLLQQLSKALLERALQTEMSEHPDYEKGDPAGQGSGNSRNGTLAKTVLTDVGPLEVDVPRRKPLGQGVPAGHPRGTSAGLPLVQYQAVDCQQPNHAAVPAPPHCLGGDKLPVRHAGSEDRSGILRQQSPSDEELIQELRDGFAQGRFHKAAADALYQRHRSAALARARQLSSDAHQAEDLLSESFLRTLEVLRSGAGPTIAWRPYLLTVIRNMAAEWNAENRRVLSTSDFSWLEHRARDHAFGADPQQHAVDDESRRILVRSFRQLPERWQAMLWQTTVEGVPHHVLARRLGITPNGVASLAARARKGLRETYLQAHLGLVADA
ncbi:sigma-70 family RNA polymerase sigma factor [Streptomyces roseoverticillatus]|uniref:RNA polymerase sigma factor n=1 Tax=Streptomyces roseoverticillatus TaxID=66429 RepID=UPI0034098083